jgi:hypothetical protein
MIRLKDLLTEQAQVKTTTFKQRFGKLRDAVKALFTRNRVKNTTTSPGLEPYDAAKEAKYGRETETIVQAITYSWDRSDQSAGTETSAMLSLSKLTGTYTKEEARTITNDVMFQLNDAEYTYYVQRYYLNNQLTDVLGQTQRDGSILSEVNTFDGAGSLQYSMPNEMRNAILEAFKDTNKHSEISKFITAI